VGRRLTYWIFRSICIVVAVVIRWLHAGGRKSIKQIYLDKENEYDSEHGAFGCISILWIIAVIVLIKIVYDIIVN
jgi:hypothetical protein